MSHSISVIPAGDQLGGLVSINGENVQQIPDTPEPDPLKFILGPDGETQFRTNAYFRYVRGAAADDSPAAIEFPSHCLDKPRDKSGDHLGSNLEYALKFVGRKGFRTMPGGAFDFGNKWSDYEGVKPSDNKTDPALFSQDVVNREYTRYRAGNRDLTSNYGAGRALSIKSNNPGPTIVDYKAMGANAVGSGFYSGFEQPKWAVDGLPYVKPPSNF
jgi:hypothetical protein